MVVKKQVFVLAYTHEALGNYWPVLYMLRFMDISIFFIESQDYTDLSLILAEFKISKWFLSIDNNKILIFIDLLLISLMLLISKVKFKASLRYMLV